MSDDSFKAKRKSRDEKPKKERKIKKNGKMRMGCWARCAITCAVIFVVLVGGIMGGAFWAWGKYVEPGMQMSLPKFVGIIGSAYTYNEKKLVTNPYDPVVDLAGFYDGFKSKLMIDKDTQIKIQDILTGMANKPTPAAYVDNCCESLSNNTQSSVVAPLALNASGSTGNAALDALLKDLKFDFSALANYDGKPYILEVTDKQIAALLNELFSVAVSSDILPQFKQFEQTYGVKLQEVVSIKQVVIDGKKIDGVMQARLKITMALELRSTVKKIVDKTIATGNSAIPAGLIKMLPGLAPKKVFLSMSVFPNAVNAAAEVAFNNIKESDFAALLDGIDGLMSSFGGASLGIDGIFKTINDAIVSAIGSVNKYIPLSFVDTGSLDMQPIKGLMNMLKVTVSEGQFLTMIKDIKLPTAASLGVDKYTKQLRDTDVKLFINDFSKKYGISSAVAEKITADNVFTQIKAISTAPDFIDNVNLKSVDYSRPYAETKTNAKVEASYMSFAGLINSYINDNPAMLGSLNVTAMKVDFLKDDITIFAGKPKTDVLSMLVGVDLHKTLKIDTTTLFGNLLGQLCPKDLFIEIYIDMKIEAGYVPNSAVISLNQTSIGATKEHFDVITQLLAGMGQKTDTINYTAITSKVGDIVRNGIEKIESMLKADIIFESKRLLLPNIYEVVSGTSLVNPSTLLPTEKKFTDEEIFNSLKQIYQYIPYGSNCATSATKFVGELEDDLYIKNKDKDSKPEINDPDAGRTVLNSDGSNLVDVLTNLPKTFQNDISVVRMNKDKTDVKELKPILFDSELAYIINNYKTPDKAGVPGKNILDISVLKDAKIDKCNISLTNGNIEIGLSGAIVIEGKPGQTPPNLSGVLPEKLYIKVKINIAKLNAAVKGVKVEPDGTVYVPVDTDADLQAGIGKYDCVNELSINGLDNAQKGADGMTEFERFLLLVRRITHSEIYANNIMFDLKNSVVKFMHQINAGGKIKLVFAEGQIKLDTTIFDMAVDTIYPDVAVGTPDPRKPTAEEFRTVMQKVSGPSGDIAADDPCLEETDSATTSALTKIVDQLNKKFFLSDSGKIKYVVDDGKGVPGAPNLVEFGTGKAADAGLDGKPIYHKDGRTLTRKDIKVLDLLTNNALQNGYMSKVDGVKMSGSIIATDFVPAGNNYAANGEDSLKPYFTKSQIVRLLKGCINIDKKSGLSNADIKKVTYVPGEDVVTELKYDGKTPQKTQNTLLQIVLGAQISTGGSGAGGADYSKFFPKEVRIVVNIDMDALKSDINTKTEAEIAGGAAQPIYCSFTINNMTNYDAGGAPLTEVYKGNNLNCFFDMLNKMSGQALSIETIKTDISTMIRKQMRAVASGADFKFVAISSTDATKQSGMEIGGMYDIAAAAVNFGKAEMDRITNVQLQNALKGLYNDKVPEYGTIDFTTGGTPDISSPPKIKISELIIAKIINSQKARIQTAMSVDQITMVRVGLLNATLENMRVEFGSITTALNKGYVMVTVSIEMAKIYGSACSMLPKNLPVTLCICQDGAVADQIAFANMTNTDVDVFKKLLTTNGANNTNGLFGTGATGNITKAIKDLQIISSPKILTLGDVMSQGVITQVSAGGSYVVIN